MTKNLEIQKRDQTERVRLNLELSLRTKEQLEQLQHRIGAASLTEVIRRAVALLDLVTDHTQDEGSVILRAKDGKEQAIKFV